VNLNTELD